MRQLVAPLGGESVLAQRFVLQADLLSFLVVGRKAKAPGAPERLSGDCLEPVKSRLGASPELLRRFGTVRLTCDVVARGPAAQGEAAVAAARALGDATRIVHAHPQAAPCESERT